MEHNGRLLLPVLPYRGETTTAADLLKTERAPTVFGQCVLWHPVPFKSSGKGHQARYRYHKTLEKRNFFDVLQSSYTGHLKAIIHRGKDSLYLHSCEETYSLWKGFPVLWQGGKIWDCWCCQECSSQNSCCLGSFSLDKRRSYCGLPVYKGAL